MILEDTLGFTGRTTGIDNVGEVMGANIRQRFTEFRICDGFQFLQFGYRRRFEALFQSLNRIFIVANNEFSLRILQKKVESFPRIGFIQGNIGTPGLENAQDAGHHLD